jgi:hypothetical protein
MITTGLLTLECLKHFFKSRQSCWSIAKTRTNVSSADVSSMTCKEAPRQILCWKCYQTPKNIFNQSAQSDKSFVICWKKNHLLGVRSPWDRRSTRGKFFSQSTRDFNQGKMGCCKWREPRYNKKRSCIQLDKFH